MDSQSTDSSSSESIGSQDTWSDSLSEHSSDIDFIDDTYVSYNDINYYSSSDSDYVLIKKHKLKGYAEQLSKSIYRALPPVAIFGFAVLRSSMNMLLYAGK